MTAVDFRQISLRRPEAYLCSRLEISVCYGRPSASARGPVAGDLDDAALQPRVHHDLDDLPAAFWAAGLPLGIQGAYTYPETNGPGGIAAPQSPR